MSDEQNVLDLSAIAPERQKARLRTAKNPEGLRPDGTLYELRAPEEMSARELRSVGASISEMLTLWNSAKTKAEDAKIEKLLNGIACQVLHDAPVSAVRGLPAIVKRGVAMGFLARSSELAQESMGVETLMARALLLASSLHGSNGSTEETPEPG